MNYDIYIGQLELDQTEHHLTLYRVNQIHLPEAPAFDGDEWTGHGNSRHPGYSQWSNFLREAGLPNGFLVERHPGYRILTEDDQAVVGYALREWQSEHDQTPGWESGQDPVLARLLWMKWWINYALDHLTNPGVYNF